MTHPNELVRWLDDGAKSDALKLALREQAEEGPTSEQRALLFAQLTRSLEQAPSEASAEPSSKLLIKTAPWSTGILILGSAIWWAAATREVQAPTAAPVPTPREVAARGAAVHDAQPAPPAHLEDVAPAVEPSRPAPRLRPKRTVETARAPSRVDPLRELSLLTKARHALLEQPLRTLELTAEHERDYAQGMLAEEREVLAIEALLKLDRRHDAVRRARRFVVRFPGSAQRARLDQLLRPAAGAEKDGSELPRGTSH